MERSIALLEILISATMLLHLFVERERVSSSDCDTLLIREIIPRDVYDTARSRPKLLSAIIRWGVYYAL